MTQGVAVLGATGSVGLSTLEVIARHADRFHVALLVAYRNAEAMEALCRRFEPPRVIMVEPAAAVELRRRLSGAGLATEVDEGAQSVLEAVAQSDVNTVMAAIVGSAGLPSTLAAAQAGKRVLLANKEALVVAGSLLMAAVARSGATLLPIDSEQNAMWQCLPNYRLGNDMDRLGVRGVLLTASGGPFLDVPLASLARRSAAEACAHPNWDMGPKISVDSATMMNKGLEVIETAWLFNLPDERIKVVIHPQSVVHSLVEYVDGSMLAQLASPDMKVPIAHALGWPERLDSGAARLDLIQASRLDFREPDLERFPCLALARQALRTGGTAPAVLNAANEEAVAAFLSGQLGFGQIAEVVSATLDAIPSEPVNDLDQVLSEDELARAAARKRIAQVA